MQAEILTIFLTCILCNSTVYVPLAVPRILYSFSILFITLAGTPATTQLSGTSFVTTAPAATTTLLPIVNTGQHRTVPAYPYIISNRDRPAVRFFSPAGLPG